VRQIPHSDDLAVPATTLVSDDMHWDGEIHDHLGEYDDEFQALQVMVCHSYLVSQNLMA
jgi:hypothetical protein